MNKKFATKNACKLCTPLGACIAFRGVEGAVPFLHGSQGCATYIRRYIISHFKEPIDIGSSSFTENTAIFGGKSNLEAGLNNIQKQYEPKFIGIATTCLSETIGEDTGAYIRQYRKECGNENMPLLISVSTASYRGTHIDGFHQVVKALVESLAEAGKIQRRINIFPGFVSCADIRYLKEIAEDFGLLYSLLPDYSETLDAGIWPEYKKIPDGGTTIENIVNMGCAYASIEFGRQLESTDSAGNYLRRHLKVPLYNLGLPIGVNESDRFFKLLEGLSGRSLPKKYKSERGRLIDAYVDGHKYVFGKKAVVYGEGDLVAGIASFLSEIGVIPVLCACGQESGRLKESIDAVVLPQLRPDINVLEGADFVDIAEEAARLLPDFVIGSSKGYFLARKLKIPLIRIGFPIHDRIGGQRVLHLGYRGAMGLFDRIVNALLEEKQEVSSVGYSYM